MHYDTETTWRDFNIELAFITILDLIEHSRSISYQPRQYIKPSGRTLGIRKSCDFKFKFYGLKQRNNIHAAFFEHRTVFQRDPKILETTIQFPHFIQYFHAVSGQKAGING